MAKDPAFLFYSSDFTTGTQFFSNEQVGIYIRLMCAQHQHGHLSEKHMLHICGSYDKEIFEKFARDEDGNFYNIRLEERIQERKDFSKSRSENRLKGIERKKREKELSRSYDEHMENENENENKEEDNSKKLSADGFSPGPEFVATLVLPDLTAGSVIEMIRITQKVTVLPADVQDLWQAFKVQHFTGKKYYKSVPDVHSHFINWSKSQRYSNGKQAITAGGKQSNDSGANFFLNYIGSDAPSG